MSYVLCVMQESVFRLYMMMDKGYHTKKKLK